jgi:hypothetical protein
MEKADYNEATATHLNYHSLQHQYMCVDSKDMEDPDYEATATLPNDHSMLQLYMY